MGIWREVKREGMSLVCMIVDEVDDYDVRCAAVEDEIRSIFAGNILIFREFEDNLNI